MILNLRIAAFATIEEISVSFDEGLTVITGETGAGKSLLVDALFLVSGQKPRGLTVRPGSEEGIVEAAFSPLTLPIPDALSDILSSDDDIVLRRVVSANGRVRQSVNGHSISLSQLHSLVDILYDIVGQGDNSRLSQSDVHRQYLDAYAKISDLSEGFEKLRRKILTLKKERDAIRSRRETLLREQEEQIQMREDAELLSGRAGEFEDLSQTLTAQLNIQEILSVAGRSYGVLYEDDQNVLSMLARISSDLDHILSFDSTLLAIRNRLGETMEILKDSAHELHRYQGSLEMDPEHLSSLESRFNLYRRLAHKYRVRPEDVADFLGRASEFSQDLIDHELEEIELEITGNEGRLMEIGKQLIEKRMEAATRFSRAICEVLRRLRIEHPSFSVSFLPYPDPCGGPYGMEKVEFLFSANPGLPERPLGQVASGGEMSRVLLAIKSVLADCDLVSTLVFDEIDSGIGGEVGEVLGDLLKEIARKRQVIAITHLHQVARKGDQHLLVRKTTDGSHTRSRISLIVEEDRVREIARMLGGENMTPSALKIAKDLLS